MWDDDRGERHLRYLENRRQIYFRPIDRQTENENTRAWEEKLRCFRSSKGQLGNRVCPRRGKCSLYESTRERRSGKNERKTFSESLDGHQRVSSGLETFGLPYLTLSLPPARFPITTRRVSQLEIILFFAIFSELASYVIVCRENRKISRVGRDLTLPNEMGEIFRWGKNSQESRALAPWIYCYNFTRVTSSGREERIILARKRLISGESLLLFTRKTSNPYQWLRALVTLFRKSAT